MGLILKAVYKCLELQQYFLTRSPMSDVHPTRVISRLRLYSFIVDVFTGVGAARWIHGHLRWR
jgi:hypothetical protein